jgi:hypothetical protein
MQCEQGDGLMLAHHGWMTGWWVTVWVGLTVHAVPGAEPVHDWTLVSPKAAWQARDSSGEVVFRDRMWLFGGWFDSYSPPPRDVWSSADGVTWDRVTAEAPWKFSDLPMTLVFRDRMWLMGGWKDGRLPTHGATSEVWSSRDGVDWRLETSAAGWSPRLAAGVAVFKDRMWVVGGTENYYFGDATSLKRDVWSSADGVTWECATAEAPWAARAYHLVVAHAGKLWVIAGGNYVPEYEARHDVWSSTDGVHWDQVTAAAPFSPRLWFSAVSWKEHLWVIGGWSNQPAKNWGDVWISRDGLAWRELKSNVRWKERHEHSVYVHRDKLWVVGGHANPLNSEVWSLELPGEVGTDE